MASSPLRNIAGHRLIAGLGKGGMAIVYLAVSQKQFGFTKLVVLKILREEMDVEDGFVEMFLQEARLAARLNHPNIVQTYEVGVDEGRHYIAMEYLEGQALSAIIPRVGAAALPIEFQLRVICDVLEGLHYAHEAADYEEKPLGIVHRDISPQNVFVTYTGQAKILDFGIAKTSSSSRTAFGVVKGKSGYMAPEQATGSAIDRRADVFAIGVMIWEAIAQRRLVSPKDEELAALKRRITGEDPKIRDVVPDAPPELADICDKATAIDPKDRYATALDLRDAIEGYLAKRELWDARRVAAILDTSFAEERGRVRRLVDEQTKRLQTGPVDVLRRDSTASGLRSTLTGGGGYSRPVTSVTSMAEGIRPSSPPSSSLARLRGPLVMLGVVAALGTFAGIMLKRRPAGLIPQAEALQASAAVVSDAQAGPITSAASAAERYTFRLTSEPPGVVYDGDVMVGRTPFELVVDNGTLATTQRRLAVRAEGFEAHAVDLRPSTHDVTAHVVLESTARAPTNVPAPGRGRFAAPPLKASPAAPKSAETAPGENAPRGFSAPPEQKLRPLDSANPWAH